MDPNEALKNAREASKKFMEASDPREATAYAADLRIYFDALDEFLSKGGFLPQDWKSRNPNKFTGRRTVSPRGY
jgi:hypothetical protein